MNANLLPGLLIAMSCVAAPCLAQTAAAPATPATPATPASAASAASPASQAEPALTLRPSLVIESTEQVERAEPNVHHAVIEDQGSKIDELRVRGRVQHITVTPKVGTTRPYEIMIAPGGRDLTDGTGGPRNANGKRVWSVLNF